MAIDFASLAAHLLSQSRTLVPSWFPNGKMRGHEFVVGDLSGQPGQSLSVNLDTGVWRDFATDEGGADLINLYASIHQLTQGEAARELGGAVLPPIPRTPAPPPIAVVRPNGHAAGFTATHPRHGLPEALYWYRDRDGSPLWCVARYVTDDGKQFSPWTWDGTRWRAKAPAKPRSLYGLELIEKSDPGASILVVEGEKCANAGREVLKSGKHVVITWAGGASAWQTADWEIVRGRRVILWPDADAPGWACMAGLAAHLASLDCEITVIDTHDQPVGHDLHDMIAAGATAAQIGSFARSHSIRPASHLLAPDLIKNSPPEDADTPESSATQDLTEPVSESSDVDLSAPVQVGELIFANHAAAWQHFGLETGSGGMPWANVDNIVRVLREHPATRELWFDSFRERVMLGSEPWSDTHHLGRLLIALQRYVHLPKISASQVAEAVSIVAAERARHAIREYLEATPWDQVPRLATWTTLALGCPDDAYSSSLGTNWLLSMVARVYKPGCQCDSMVVLEGSQGVGKTQALRILGGPWYGTTPAAIGEKDFICALGRAWLLELEELEGLSRAHMERVRATITRQIDDYRPPYGRHEISRPRQGIMVGTTNHDSWIGDETGARRFWPLLVRAVNQSWLIQNRDQLFAEARELFLAGANWWTMPAAELSEQQENRFLFDPWHDVIRDMCERSTEVEMMHIYGALDIEVKDRSRAFDMRIAAVLKKLGMKVKLVRRGKETRRVYMKDA